MATGIDYGNGETNIDKKTGIRYGVIPAGDVSEAWYESAEEDYGPPTCPQCGEEVSDTSPALGSACDCRDYYCSDCDYAFWSDEAYGEEPIAYVLDDGEYQAEQDSYWDLFITKSPYYTLRGFCSPCAPGACHLNTSGDARCYCFGTEWFDDEYPCPYEVYRVSDNECIYKPK